MNILMLTAHDDVGSFTATLHNTALSVLERAEHKVVQSNLQAQQFNPVTSSLDFNTSSGTHAEYIFEQQRAINTGSGFSPDIQAEMDKVAAADLIIMHFPLKWSSPPAILQGWLEKVLAMGFAWNAEAKYEKGLMRGKRVLVTTVVGDPEAFYSSEGIHKASVQQHLFSLLHSTLAFCGFDVLEPFIIMNATAQSQLEREHDVKAYGEMLKTIETDQNFIFKHS